MRKCFTGSRPGLAGLLPVLFALWAVGAFCVVPAQAGFEKIVLDSNVNGPKSVQVLDLDGVNGLDILAVHAFDDRAVWYENNGVEVFTMHTIGTMTNPSAIAAGDLNNDTYLDVVVASFTAGTENWYLSYYLNDGSENFTRYTIETDLEGAVDLVLANLDTGSSLDIAVVGYESDTVVWYESNGATTPSFTRHDIATDKLHSESIDAADIDGDGDIDLATTAYFDGEILWWENSGGASPTFTEHLAAGSINGPKDVSVVNVDGDGDLDLVAVAYDNDEVIWLDNNGSESFTATVVGATPRGPVAVTAGDRNGDTFIDLVVGCFDADQLVSFANDGSETFTMTTVDAALGGAESPVIVDLDQSGEISLVAAGFHDDNIVWYVDKSIFYDGYTFDDTSGGNGDGNPDPGETITLVIDIRNEGDFTLTNVSGELSSNQPGYVTFNTATATYPDIPVASSASNNTPNYSFTLSPTTPCGQAISFALAMTADQDSGGGGFGMTVGGIVDDMESGEGGWTHYADTGIDDWAIVTLASAHSPTQAWFGSDVAEITDKSLVTSAVSITGSAFFSFWHTYNFEGNWDGGVLELSTDGGSSWADIGALITSGNGYNATLGTGYDNPLEGRNAWSGGTVGTMEEVVVDLTSYLGATAHIRFRIGCDNIIGDVGWYIDDVTLEDCQVFQGATIDCNYVVSPLSGTLPMTINHNVTMTNMLSGGIVYTRRIAGRINVNRADGWYVGSWRAGFTQLAPGTSWNTTFNTNLPAVASVLGTNTFTLVAEDVTPFPYNQSPYPPSGDTATAGCTVTGIAP
jgi:hypothetical protein